MKPDRPIPPMHSLTIAIVCLVLTLICVGLILSGCASSRTGRVLNVAVVAAGCP